MSVVPKRKPLPSGPEQDGGAITQSSAADSSPMNAGPDTDVGLNQIDPIRQRAGSRLLDMTQDSLIVKEATLRQMAYLLLDLTSNLTGDSPERLQDNTNARAQTAQILSSSAPPIMESEFKPQIFTTQEVLERETHKVDGISQVLLQRKPWSHERVLTVDILEVAANQAGDEAQEEDYTAPKVGAESIQLRTSKHNPLLNNQVMTRCASARQPQDMYRLQENSLYTLEGDHPWTDLYTHLGKGQFTREGQEYWFSTRHGWPAAPSAEWLERNIAELWCAMTANAPDPEMRYAIISDLARDYGFPVAYKQVIARIFSRNVSFRTLELPRNRKRGRTSKMRSRWQALYRNLFSTVDSTRARLPSTAYLRIVGQGLFKNSLPLEGAYAVDTSVHVLIASLRLLANRSIRNREARILMVENHAPAMLSPKSSLSESSTSVLDLLVTCYRHRILQQPPAEHEEILRSHVDQLLSSLQLINVFTSGPDLGFLQSLTIDEILSSSVESICSRANQRRRDPTYPRGNSDYFAKKELNVKTLQNVGALNVLWTRHIDDHLALDTQFAELRIFWPAWAMANLPCMR